MTHADDAGDMPRVRDGRLPGWARTRAFPGRPARGGGGVGRAGRAATIVATAAGAFLIGQPAAGAQTVAGAAPAAAARSAGSAQFAAAPRARVTAITVNGRRPGATFDGIGAISGGGGNSRYLIDYPPQTASQILDYLFKPHYGASLQMLKLEIGGDSNSSDGSEPSVEPAQGDVNCNAGYEWWIAEQALRRNPGIKLYGLQWGAPGWTGDTAGSLWTQQDVNYIIDWLNCARSHGLTISYLGGRNEAGYNRSWYEMLRAALNANGYGSVQIVAADASGAARWHVANALAKHQAFSQAVSVIGVHDPCGRGQYTCASTRAATSLHKPLWLSEQGELNPNTQAANEARVINRMYIRGHMTAMFEWPLLNAMPPGLPYESRGLVTAGQPWSGFYTVNKQTWATAQTTQFTAPGWRYVRRAGTLLGRSGSAVAYMSPHGSDWSMVAENTGSHAGQTIRPQRINVTVAGGLKARAIHVWTTKLASANPSKWFVEGPTLHPVGGRFHYTVRPNSVVTFTTTRGQSKANGNPPFVPPPAPLPLPYSNSLTSDDGSDEPPLLAPLDGAFELGPCIRASGSCLQQVVPQTPVLWHSDRLDYPYAVIGDPSWANYTVSVRALMTSPTDTAGVIGRLTERASRATTPAVGNRIGLFEGYMLDVTENGAWEILRNGVDRTIPQVLTSGSVQALKTGTWHTLSLSMNGGQISAALDGKQLGSPVTDSAYASGLAGIEAGAFTGLWPQVQYRDLSVTPLP